MLTLRQISVEGFNKPRLNNLNLTLNDAQLVGIIGGNGAGKSTLIQTIAGLLPQATGECVFKQRVLTEISASERAKVMAYLPQFEQPQWDITVIELLQIGMLQLSLSKQQRQQRIELQLKQCDLEPLANRLLSTLSGGERQRALLARALVSDPALLLCDEPTAALDIKHQLQTMALLRRQAGQGQLVLCCLHDLSMAARFCDQLVLLDNGNLVDAGSPAKVLSDKNLASAFGVNAEWFCSASGVAWIPQPLEDQS